MLVSQHYWWPRINDTIRRYVEGCTICQQMKPINNPHNAPLLLIRSAATRPFQQISMDFITDLPLSNGYDSIMVTVDHGLTKGVIFSPCNKMINAIDTATLIINNVYHCFGLPNVVISDRGPQFSAKVFKKSPRSSILTTACPLHSIP